MVIQSTTSELRRCENDVRQLQSEAESMTSRSGHVMASATLHGLQDRLRHVERSAADSSVSLDADVVAGQIVTSGAGTSSTLTSTVGNVRFTIDLYLIVHSLTISSLLCFHFVGWATGRASGL